ncbi:MAG: tetratricopeptide repeat protein [Thermoplasmatota archaeon]
MQGAVLENSTRTGVVFLSIKSGEMVVRQQSSDVSIDGAGITPTQDSATTTQLHGASISGFAFATGVRLLVLPQHLYTRGAVGNSTLQPSSDGTLVFPVRASRESPWTIKTENSLVFGRPNLGNDTLEGSSQFIVWGANFTLKNETGSHVIETGSFDTPVGAPGSPVVRRVQREAILQIDDGLVTVDRALPFRVYLANFTLALATGALDLANPTGADPVNGEPLTGGRILQLSAPLVAKGGAVRNGVTLGFPQPPAAANLDGSFVRSAGRGLGVVVFLLVALLAVPAGAAAYSQLELRRRLRSLDRFISTRRFESALVLARRIRDLRPRQPEALVAESLCLIQVGQYGEAAAILASGGWPVALDSMRDYLRATAAAGQGNRGAALRWLQRCLRTSPDMAAEVAANPWLKDFLGAARPTNDGSTLAGAMRGPRPRRGNHVPSGDA